MEMCPECVEKNPKHDLDDPGIIITGHYKLCKCCRSRISDYRFLSNQLLEQLLNEESCHMNKRPQFKTVNDIPVGLRFSP